MGQAREIVQQFNKGMGILSEALPQTMQAMAGFMGAAAKDGVLTHREKELIAIGVALYTRCPECIAVHCQKALETDRLHKSRNPGGYRHGYGFRQRPGSRFQRHLAARLSNKGIGG